MAEETPAARTPAAKTPTQVDAAGNERHPGVGWTLTLVGGLGLVTGIVPFAVNALHAFFGIDLGLDLAAHGVASMGLSAEWALLSSAMGTFLGAVMVWAGVGWLRARRWAPLVSWLYVLCSIGVNATDLLIFTFIAKPAATRSLMLVLDGIALFISVVLGLWLIRRRSVEMPQPP
jgi:hypothetical protein